MKRVCKIYLEIRGIFYRNPKWHDDFGFRRMRRLFFIFLQIVYKLTLYKFFSYSIILPECYRTSCKGVLKWMSFFCSNKTK